MNHVSILALLLLVAVPTQETKEEKAASKYTYDAFKAWDAFAVGSSVVIEMNASGNKITTTKTIDSKEADVIHLKTLMAMGALPDPIAGTEDVKKPDGRVLEGDCPLCNKAYKDHKDESTWSEKKLKIGDREVTCQVMESAAKTCDGKENANKFEIWYSKVVPGHLVMMKMAAFTMTCTKFEDKTVREGLKK